MEIFDICDEKGQPIGGHVERSVAHARGICHRTAHVWVLRRRKNRVEVLLQKRAMDKDSFPGLYDTSAAGHIQAGDEPLESALRELEEELGIHAKPEDLTFVNTFRIQYESEFHGKPFKDNEVAFVYAYEKPVRNGALKLQKEEVDAVEWFDMEKVYQACLQGKRENKFCVPLGGIRTIRHYAMVGRFQSGMQEAQVRINEILAKYGPTVKIQFHDTNAEITDSWRVTSKEDRCHVCEIMTQTGVSPRHPLNLSSEWQLHNIAYRLHVGRSHARDVNMDYLRDPHLVVHLCTKLFDLLQIR